MNTRFVDLLNERSYLLADGATGTNYFNMGLVSGDAPELWNIDHPDRVASLHREFLEAGSDIILTNTFGGSRYRLKLHNAQDRVRELNISAAHIARQEAGKHSRPIIVAGSMGPTGEIFEPVGELSFEDGKQAFAEQAAALAEGGVDVLWLETLSSKEELEAAIAGASVTDLPIVSTLSFDTNGSTMMGITPVTLANICAKLSPAPVAYGTNCGVGPSEVAAAIMQIHTDRTDSILVAKANCGIPEFKDGAIRYDGTPELMADYACLARDAGARIIGGCCGTTPGHIRRMRDALDTTSPGPKPDIDTIETRLGKMSDGARSLCYRDVLEQEQPRGRRNRRRRRVH